MTTSLNPPINEVNTSPHALLQSLTASFDVELSKKPFILKYNCEPPFCEIAAIINGDNSHKPAAVERIPMINKSPLLYPPLFQEFESSVAIFCSMASIGLPTSL